MKLHCDRAALTDAAALIANAASKRSPRPQLTCALLTATAGEGLKMAATDGEISLQLEVPMVDVAEPGTALIPAAKLLQILRSMTDATVKVEAEDGEQCQIIGEASQFRMFTYKAEDFPPMPEADMAEALACPAGDFKRLVSQTTFAAADPHKATRYAINGIFVRQKKGVMELVATDGNRLARASASVPNASASAASGIVPGKAMEMVEAIAGGDEAVQVMIEGYRAVFAIGEDGDPRAVLTTTLVEGTFPPVEDVIPKQWTSKATCGREALIAALQQAQLMTNEESRGVLFDFKGGALELSSRAPEMGDAMIQVDLTSYDGPDIAIGFNPKFIAAAAKAATGQEITLEFGDAPKKPGVIRCTDFVHVAMPVHKD